MRVEIKNQYGSFEMGGGNHSTARIENITGLGLPIKESNTITFAGQPGQMTESVRDLSRTITITFDFYGGQHEIEKLYKILYYSVELWFTFGTRRRKITGRCINPQDVETIIFRKHYRAVLQFVCDNPYFKDFYDTQIAVFSVGNQFPNVYENGEWYIQLPAVATTRTTTATITNDGDIDIYPIIRILHKASDASSSSGYGVEVSNLTTGARIVINYQTSAGEEIIVDLPHRKLISNIRGNITNYISNDTNLSAFILAVGKNEIKCISKNVSETMSVTVEYSNNYLMAVMK